MNIVDKIVYICNVAKRQICNDEEKKELCALAKEHSEHYHLGKVFGYSVSDFAIACLSWTNCNNEFDKIYSSLEKERKEIIEKLIKSEIYTQLS